MRGMSVVCVESVWRKLPTQSRKLTGNTYKSKIQVMKKTSSITSKGQVTIPHAIREKFGLLPHTEVEFVVTNGTIQLMRAKKGSERGAKIVERMRQSKWQSDLTTNEIMKLTRGDK